MTKEFVEFPKIARLSREVIVTEKIDGTNGCIYIRGESDEDKFLVGSRTRWITPENDNHGFAKWAYEHRDELSMLGTGLHFGEWWGAGIQRGYGLPKGEKRWSIFNVTRWCLHGEEPKQIPTGDPRQVKMQDVLPVCVGLVPVLDRFIFDTEKINITMAGLIQTGSHAAPGFMNPEGVVVYHVAGNVMFKKTFGNDGAKSAGAK